jgi:hypothetical protein
LELWFARTLRDAFALAATGVHASFTDIASDRCSRSPPSTPSRSTARR